jgi:HEAT repeat protein
MKRTIISLVMILTLAILQNINFGQEFAVVKSTITSEDIEKNLVAGVETDNLGLKVSSAYYLGERRSDRAIIPLMSILHTDKSEEARIIAALSLYKIGSERGIYAVKRAAEYDESESVRRLCKIFYDMHMKDQKEN